MIGGVSVGSALAGNGRFKALPHDLRATLSLTACRDAEPLMRDIDSRTSRSPPKIGPGANYDGAKTMQRSKQQSAIDTLAHMSVLHMTPVNFHYRPKSSVSTAAMQDATGKAIMKITPGEPTLPRTLKS